MSYAQYSELRGEALKCVLDILPLALREELLRLGDGKAIFGEGLSEIRARVGDVSLAVFSGVNLPIRVRLTRADIADTVLRIHGGALYMHRESLAESFLPMEHGVRVGIVGTYYEGAVGDASALVFRLPFFSHEIGQRLKGLIERSGRLRPALIYSPPAGGKTTAIRSLALRLAEDARRRVVAIDERREMPACLSRETSLDILYGYKKADGIEVATRLLNPEIIILDELGSEAEAEAVFRASSRGVPIVATAHAQNTDELMRLPSLGGLIRSGVFELLIGLRRDGREYNLCVKEVEG